MDELTIILLLVTVGLFVVAWVKHDQRGLYFIDMITGVLAIGALVEDAAVNPDLLHLGIFLMVTFVLLDIAAFVAKPNIEVD